MKLAVLGGGGVRSPFLAKSITSNAGLANIDEVVFMDNDFEKIRIFGGLAKIVSNKINKNVNFSYTTDAEKALKDADFVITTLRVGGDECRVFDERTALDLNLLGQETTGAGGFGMAMRSIPALLGYCDLARKVAKKNVLIFNFTNPSGLVTQAMRDAGHKNVFGICDAPSEFIKQLQRAYNVTPEDFSIKCYGLNHLSWFKEMIVKGEDVTQEFLDNKEKYLSTDMRSFEREIPEIFGDSLMNEYLQYYVYSEKKIQKILDAPQTRGELIQSVNAKMLEKLKDMDIEKNTVEAFDIFLEHYMIRENSYGFIETGVERIDLMEKKTLEEFISEPDAGGYAAVALNFIKAYVSGDPCEMVLSVSNDGAIGELKDSDVVEVSCLIHQGSVKTVPVTDIDEMQVSLMRRMKLYERMAVDAIMSCSRKKAIKALMINPFVRSYSLACEIVDKYIARYKEYIGEWN